MKRQRDQRGAAEAGSVVPADVYEQAVRDYEQAIRQAREALELARWFAKRVAKMEAEHDSDRKALEYVLTKRFRAHLARGKNSARGREKVLRQRRERLSEDESRARAMERRGLSRRAIARHLGYGDGGSGRQRVARLLNPGRTTKKAAPL